MSGAADLAQKAWTEAELEALPEDGFIHEVVGGELVMSPKNDFFHGDKSRQGISRSLWLAHSAQAYRLRWLSRRRKPAPWLPLSYRGSLQGLGVGVKLPLR